MKQQAVNILKTLLGTLPAGGGKEQKVLLSTCMRSGSTWVYRLFGQLLDQRMGNFAFFPVTVPPENPDGAEQRCREAFKFIKRHRRVPAFKTHGVPVDSIALLLDKMPNLKVVNIHRDYKDIIVSRLFYDRYRRGWDDINKRSKWIEAYDSMSDEQMVNSFIGSRHYAKFLHDWAAFHVPFKHERYLVLKYDQMLSAYEENVEKLAAFIGVHDQEVIASAIHKCHFSNMATDVKGRSHGDMVKHDHCRKGVAGDYKTYMTEETILRCNADIKKSLESANTPALKKTQGPAGKKQKDPIAVEVIDPKTPAVVIVPQSNSHEKTFVVLGCARGGTSMIAGILRIMGIWMGDNLGCQQENKQAFGKEVPLKTKIQKIREYNELYACWGWKHPATFKWIDKVKLEIRNPHFIMVYRNPIDISLSFVKHGGRAFSGRLVDAQLSRYQKISKALGRMDSPLMYVSYERGIQQKQKLVEELSRFTGTELTDEMQAEIYDFINPEKGYQRIKK